ncbi:conserved hypothetical protein [Roseibium sp. TrichSKD4]|nr:conserved hypothetical protein [Roseibium sp. TrichSKD4]
MSHSDDENLFPLHISAQDVWILTSQALLHTLPDLSREIKFIRDNCRAVFDAPPMNLPYTLCRGTSEVPFVSMSFQGTAADALCVAHEFGHALQLHLARGRFIPPVLREIAAFVAEKVLLDLVQKEKPELFAPLYAAWQQDNTIYFGSDAELLKDALRSPEGPYIYRLNYPLARYFADEIHANPTQFDLESVFRGNLSLSECLSRMQSQIRAASMNNYLPEVPEAEKDRPAINAYRSLGMMALLDIDYWQGESEKSIEEYYSARLAHMQVQTAFVVIGNERKPIGYAMWETDKIDKNVIHLKRQAAPFGDHLYLQKKLQTLFPENAKIYSHHTRSARREQVAW